MSADSPRRSVGTASRGVMAAPVIVPPQVVSDRSILDSAIGFINEVTLANQPPLDTKDTITWARFETSADISDPRFGEDWELEGNVAPPLLLILGYGLGVQVWAIPANGEAVEVLAWRHGIVTALKILPTPLCTSADEDNGRADEPVDLFVDKRPLIALVDGSSSSGSQPQFCAVNFLSLKTGAQVKTIKFKNPVIEVLANRSSVVITFHERIAVFDSRTLEDRLTITTCYPSPGINPNPAALGPRWLAYAENKLLHTKRSGGGCDGDGVASYTATVLNASKSLVKGLRELGEQVAAGLTGTSGSTSNSKNACFDSGCSLDTKQPGVVTVIDIKNTMRDYSPTSGVPSSSIQAAGTDTIIAHFLAHSEALVAMEFDNSGMLLVTADRRGHDFHVFRIQPNPVGSSLAAVHHLYILHRGDTSSKVQNITLTLDSRWVAVSTLRGTTHVFPITPYGGTMGVRTHTSLHVVNKLSRFHRSAGLSGEGRSNSPISHSESTTFSQSLQPYNNSTLPPFPRPTIVMPLAQLRQPFALGSPQGSASLSGVKSVTSVTGPGPQRQRLSSLSDDSGKPLSVCAIFAKSRSWLLDPPNVTREAPHRMQRKAVDSLFVMAGHGALIQYDLDTKLSSSIVKEKICDDTPIELEVEAKAQWNLGRRKEGSQEIMPPLSGDNWLIRKRNSCMLNDSSRQYDDTDDRTESWLSQVEIITHAGPHRRLWMGPQFVFKTYNTPSGSNLNHVDIEAVEIGTTKSSSVASSEKFDKSSPLNMPLSAAGRSSAVPVLIESGSYSSIEQSPKLMDRFRHDHLDSDYSVAHGDSRLKEDLADAMRESPSSAASAKEKGESAGSSDNVAFYDALTAEDDQIYVHAHSASAVALASVLPNIHSYDKNSNYENLEIAKKAKISIEKIVNPLGTVTTINSCLSEVKTDILDEVVSQLAREDTVIHENCDESLFRPVVAIFCDEKTLLQNEEEARRNSEKYKPPEIISSKLVVPVIAKEVNDELRKREKEKTSAVNSTDPKNIVKEQIKFEKLSLLNKKLKEDKKAINSEDELSVNGEKEVNNKQKVKISNRLPDIKGKQKAETSFETKEAEYSKVLTASKDSKAKMEVMSDLKTKKKIPIHGNRSTDLQEPRKSTQTYLSSSENVQQEINCKSKAVCEEIKKTNLKVKEADVKVKNIEAKIETKSSDGIEQNEKDVENQETCNQLPKDLKNTAIISSNTDETDITKNKLETNVLSKSKSKVATKEKVKKSKDTMKTNNRESNLDISESKYTEKKFERTQKIESKTVINKRKNGNDATNPFIDEVEERLISKSISENIFDASSKTEDKLDSAEINSSEGVANEEQSFDQKNVNLKKAHASADNEVLVLNNDKRSSEISKKSEADLEKDPKYLKESSNTKQPATETRKKTAEAATRSDKEINSLESKSKCEKKLKEDDTDCDDKNVIKTNKTSSSHSDSLCEMDKVFRKETESNKFKQCGEEELKAKPALMQEISCVKKYHIENKLSDSKAYVNTSENENKIRISTLNQTSPKKKGKEPSKCDMGKRKTSNANTFCKDESKENTDEDKTKLKCNTIVNEPVAYDLNVCVKPRKDVQKLVSPIFPPVSAWKTLSGADMINKNLNKYDFELKKSSLLETESKMKAFEKLLPEIPTPADIDKQTTLDEFLTLKSLDPLPPLPDLEPLNLMSENRTGSSRDISLITFESPLIENPASKRKITPAPRGFTEQNLIFALCGSLHFENEQIEKNEVSPSSNQSSSAFEEASLADFKSLTENDDPYISLEQSSQDTNTNTTTTNTNNEKFFSSSNSSGSEEIVKVEEKKITKKQKRKKQQLKDFHKEQNQQQEIDDEELRPLIAMTESQIYQTATSLNETLPTSSVSLIKNQSPATKPVLYSTTTDSEGPLPATTSDDNVFSVPVSGTQNTHKIKTKKLEHKINLIGAIEAATSSSTSSAEESGVEIGGRCSNDNGESLISALPISTIPLPIVVASQTTVGGLKKKTKRRKR